MDNTPEWMAPLASQLSKTLAPRDVVPAGPKYLEEPRGRFTAAQTLVLTPRSTEQVADTIRICSDLNIGIVPYAGGTGLVGGQTQPPRGKASVILSVEKMNRIRELDSDGAVLVAEAGVILSDVQDAASEVDLLYPVSLASEGSCRIGGTLATNAGGVNVIRYGNTRDLVLGVEAVLPDGSILHGLKKLRKDNTGFDLRHLLIGSEGTLGIITAASLRLMPRPVEQSTALITVPDPQAAVALLGHLQATLGDAITAFELMNQLGFSFVRDHIDGVDVPFPELPQWAVLVDLGAGRDAGLQERFEAAFETAMDRQLALDAVLAQSEAQRSALWAVRESIPLANRVVGAISNHDISVPVSSIAEFIAQADAAVCGLGPLRVGAFGHVGDGNLHYNVYPEHGQDRDTHDILRPVIKQVVHDLVHQFSGSVAAEHGVGRMKVEDLAIYGDPTKLAAMRAIKSALDPKGIMNPGVFFD
ncbi:MAG: FAD-binding oxidoreductase [Pseudomonadota bacterium]